MQGTASVAPRGLTPPSCSPQVSNFLREADESSLGVTWGPLIVLLTKPFWGKLLLPFLIFLLRNPIGAIPSSPSPLPAHLAPVVLAPSALPHGRSSAWGPTVPPTPLLSPDAGPSPSFRLSHHAASSGSAAPVLTRLCATRGAPSHLHTFVLLLSLLGVGCQWIFAKLPLLCQIPASILSLFLSRIVEGRPILYQRKQTQQVR